MVADGRMQLSNIHAWLGRTLEAKLVEAKSKKDTLKARAKSAATSKQISDMLQGLNSSNAVTAFERMEEKVMALEGEAEATLQVSNPTPETLPLVAWKFILTSLLARQN